jgi:hypothetical protein
VAGWRAGGRAGASGYMSMADAGSGKRSAPPEPCKSSKRRPNRITEFSVPSNAQCHLVSLLLALNDTPVADSARSLRQSAGISRDTYLTAAERWGLERSLKVRAVVVPLHETTRGQVSADYPDWGQQYVVLRQSRPNHMNPVVVNQRVRTLSACELTSWANTHGVELYTLGVQPEVTAIIDLT